jgi:regulator of sirC expression with transglutaminase-like and TPR domain
MNKFLPIIALVTFAAAPGTAPGQVIDHAYQYQACMTLAREAPQEAFETALTWRGLGGGDAAEHCVAVALIGLGQHTKAAARLEALARKTKQGAAIKAGLLAHAAQAWILAGRAMRAESVLTAALKLTPSDSALMVDRAQARAGYRDYAGAVEDLSRAIELGGGAADAFVFRASAYRHLDRLELALADIEKALAFRPTHPEGLLERGILRRLREDNDGARQDWLVILRTAPGSPAADAARRNLESMDVKPD